MVGYFSGITKCQFTIMRIGDEYSKMNNYTQKRKLMTRIILITIYSAFIGYLLADIQSIANWNYTVHEMLYLPLNVATFIFPVEICIWMYYVIKSIKELRGFMNKVRIKTSSLKCLLFTSVILIILFFYIQTMNVSTGGIMEVDNKFIEKNNYYLQIYNKKIKCTLNEYNLVEQGKKYVVDYTWNTNWPEKGKLTYIKPINRKLE